MQKIESTAGKFGDMKHPAREEWMEFIYGELAPAQHAALATHLKECPACAQQVAQWRTTLATLNEYKITARPTQRSRQPVLKWAIAAALVIGVGLGFGASFLLAANAKSSVRQELRAEMKTQIARERGELLAQVMKVVDEKRAEDARATLTALDQLNTAHRADYNALHADLETVAVTTQKSLQQAQRQIVTLANYTQPVP
jgi:hypothetical protein